MSASAKRHARIKEEIGAQRRAGAAGGSEAVARNLTDPKDHALVAIDVFGRDNALKLADWHEAFSVAGLNAIDAPLVSRSAVERQTETDLAIIFAMAFAQDHAPENAMAIFRQIDPEKTARGYVRGATEREPDKSEAIKAILVHHGRLSYEIRKALAS